MAKDKNRDKSIGIDSLDSSMDERQSSEDINNNIQINLIEGEDAFLDKSDDLLTTISMRKNIIVQTAEDELPQSSVVEIAGPVISIDEVSGGESDSIKLEYLPYIANSGQRTTLNLEESVSTIHKLIERLYRLSPGRAKALVESMNNIDMFEYVVSKLNINPGRTTYGQNLLNDIELRSLIRNRLSSVAQLTRALEVEIHYIILVEELKNFITMEKITSPKLIVRENRSTFFPTDHNTLYIIAMTQNLFTQYFKTLEFLKDKYTRVDKLSSNTMLAEISKQRQAVRYSILNITTADNCFSYLKKALSIRLFKAQTVASRENPELFFGSKLTRFTGNIQLMHEILTNGALLSSALQDTASSHLYELMIDRSIVMIDSCTDVKEMTLDEIRKMWTLEGQFDLSGLITGGVAYVNEVKESQIDLINVAKGSADSTVIIKDVYKTLASYLKNACSGMSKVLQDENKWRTAIADLLIGSKSVDTLIRFHHSYFNAGFNDLELLAISLNDGYCHFKIDPNVRDLKIKEIEGLEHLVEFYYPVDHNTVHFSQKIVAITPADMVSHYRYPDLFILGEISKNKGQTGIPFKYVPDEINVSLFDSLYLYDPALLGYSAELSARISAVVQNQTFYSEYTLGSLLRGELVNGARCTFDQKLYEINSRYMSRFVALLSYLEANENSGAQRREFEHVAQEVLLELFNSSPVFASLTKVLSHDLLAQASRYHNEDYLVAKARRCKEVYNQVGFCVLIYMAQLTGSVSINRLSTLINIATRTYGVNSNFKDYFKLAK